MNKYLSFGIFGLGLGIFVGTLAVVSAPVRLLRSTEDEPIVSVYEAPIVEFKGEVPKLKGMGHREQGYRVVKKPRPETVRVSIPEIEIVAEVESSQPRFGQFSTAAAMNYQSGLGHSVKAPNPVTTTLRKTF